MSKAPDYQEENAEDKHQPQYRIIAVMYHFRIRKQTIDSKRRKECKKVYHLIPLARENAELFPVTYRMSRCYADSRPVPDAVRVIYSIRRNLLGTDIQKMHNVIVPCHFSLL